ncbi:hypothetical protein [Ensifer sp.]|jgi:uncharacterized protein YjiS (DUF1127 family)|uniref:DUF1127 domain-containing protein n=1 Tax=Ensifer sp. TaxID=1872086 RepID=UPI002E10F460|nr:hypothetical protein [Ensifer sp.]
MSSLLSGMSEFTHAVWLDLNQPARHIADSVGRHDPFRLFAIWDDRLRFREQLLRIARQNPELLDDVGLTRAQIDAETSKPFWQR